MSFVPTNTSSNIRSSPRLKEPRPWGYLIAYLIALLWPIPLVAISKQAQALDISVMAIFSDALAFIALNILALQVIVPSRVRSFTGVFGTQKLLRFHRAMGTCALAFVIIHVLLLIVDTPGKTLPLFNSITAPPRARAAAIALVSMIILDVTSRTRLRMRMEYERWRFVHVFLAVVILGASFVHAVLVAHFSRDDSLRWGMFLMIAAAGAAVFYLRIARPYGGSWLDYRVVAVERENRRAATLILRPDEHDGFAFSPGQFAWLKFSDTRYSLKEHPFSMASSAVHPEELRFTYREVGEFTDALQYLTPDTKVLLDGPYGAWQPPEGKPITFVAGGVGVTPALSALATALDIGTPVPIHVIYACKTVDDIVGADVLQKAEQLPNVTIHIIPSTPPVGWQGYSGSINTQLLHAISGENPTNHAWFICGSKTLIHNVSGSLDQMRVPAKNIYLETF